MMIILLLRQASPKEGREFRTDKVKYEVEFDGTAERYIHYYHIFYGVIIDIKRTFAIYKLSEA